jgi:hypothetical protein
MIARFDRIWNYVFKRYTFEVLKNMSIKYATKRYIDFPEEFDLKYEIMSRIDDGEFGQMGFVLFGEGCDDFHCNLAQYVTTNKYDLVERMDEIGFDSISKDYFKKIVELITS